jgi:hypothetical protein
MRRPSRNSAIGGTARASSPTAHPGTYGALDIATEDADALWDRALAAGATVYSRCRTCSGVTATGSSSTPSATVGGSRSTSATFRPRRSPGPRQPCLAARRADDACQQIVSSDPACRLASPRLVPHSG